MPPDVSFVIVTWNSRREIQACLDSIAAHAPRGMWEAIVVDNSSSDGTADVVLGRPDAVVIANATNRGLAAANNQGLAAASAPHVVVCNPDVLFTAGAVDALVSCLDRHPRAAFAFARLVSPDGTQQTCAGDLPTLRTALLGRQAARRTASAPTRGFWWDAWTHDEERQIPRGLEACYVVRRDAIPDIGPQDEHYPLDWEGIDWCARASARGWEIWFCPDALVVHEGGGSIRQAQLRWVLQSHRGMYRYFADRRAPALRPLLAAAIGGRAVLKAALVVAGPARYHRSHPGER